MNNEKLKIDLCGRLPYGVKVSCENTLGKNEPHELLSIERDKLTIRKKSFPYRTYVKLSEGLPYLFPISSLTSQIQLSEYNNGEPFVPIVEILKIEHKNCYEEKLGTRYAEIEYKETPNSAKAWFSFMATKDTNLYTLMPWNFPLWIIDLLNQWKIDYRGLINEGLAIEVNSDNNPYL